MNLLIDQFQNKAGIIFLEGDLLLIKLKNNSSDELEEIVHELRVSFRKLISLLYFYKPLLRNNERNALNKTLKILLESFGTLRTEHVLIKSADKFSASLGKLELLLFNGIIQRELEKCRDLEKNKRTLDPLKFRVLYEETLKMFLGYGKEIFKTSVFDIDIASNSFVKKRFYELMGIVEKRERDLDYESIKEVHKFRVLAKNINYTLKTFEDIIGEIAVKKGEHLKKIQDITGKIHDAEIHLKMVTTFETSEREEEIISRFMEYIIKERVVNIERLKNAIQ